jgi:hypothetical protein
VARLNPIALAKLRHAPSGKGKSSKDLEPVHASAFCRLVQLFQGIPGVYASFTAEACRSLPTAWQVDREPRGVARERKNLAKRRIMQKAVEHRQVAR